LAFTRPGKKIFERLRSRNFGGNASREKLVVWGMLALAGTAFITAGFLTFLAWQQSCFVGRIQAELSQRLFAWYLRHPYCFTCSGIRRS